MQANNDQGLSFRAVLKMVLERERSGGFLAIAKPSKKRKGKKGQTILTTGDVFQMRCCECGVHLFWKGMPEDFPVVFLSEPDVTVITPLCGSCMKKIQRQREYDLTVSATVELDVDDANTTVSTRDKQDDLVTSVVVSQISPIATFSVSLDQGVGKSGRSFSTKIRRERVVGASQIRCSCRRRPCGRVGTRRR